jgi:RNA methyltransferase, TrmH family
MKKTTKKDKYPNVLRPEKAILSKRNDVRISRVRQLLHRQYRDQEHVFLCEGARFLVKAFEHGCHIESCICTPQLFTTSFADKLLRQFDRRGIPVLRVTKEVFLSISMADEPSGLMAVCGQRIRKLPKIDIPGMPYWLALNAVRSPGNLGTIMRTCSAVGVSGMVLLDRETDPYHPAAVRASMGSIMELTIVRASWDELTNWAKRADVQILGTAPSATLDYRDADYEKSTVIVMGSERKGMEPQLQKRCDSMVRIPMSGPTDSLNLAVATGVILYELLNRRRTL